MRSRLKGVQEFGKKRCGEVYLDHSFHTEAVAACWVVMAGLGFSSTNASDENKMRSQSGAWEKSHSGLRQLLVGHRQPEDGVDEIEEAVVGYLQADVGAVKR